MHLELAMIPSSTIRDPTFLIESLCITNTPRKAIAADTGRMHQPITADVVQRGARIYKWEERE